jgi:inorganic pyrophosphatase
MPTPYDFVPAGPDLPRTINVIVEIPKGKRSKFEVCKQTGLIKLDRYLYSAAHYPSDYGYIPQTLSEDGDPLDAIVMVNEPTFPGCLIEARPLGLFRMIDKGDNDFKVLCVPSKDPIFAEYDSLERVPPHFLREVEHFFSTYKQLEGGQVVSKGWDDLDAAHAEILLCVERYQKADAKAVAEAEAKVKRHKEIANKRLPALHLDDETTTKAASARIVKSLLPKVAGKKPAKKPAAKKPAKKK